MKLILIILLIAACSVPPVPPVPPKPPDEGGEVISAEEAAWVDETSAVRMYPWNQKKWADLSGVALTPYGEYEILRLHGTTLQSPIYVRWYRVEWMKWFVWDNDGLVREIQVELR